MQRLSGIVLLLVLGISCTKGHVEDLLGLPEYDIFGLDLEDTYYAEREERSIVDPEELLTKLCSQYDLQLDSKTLNCQNIRIVPKTLQINEHILRKRQAEEPPLEGSGDYVDIVPANEQTQDHAETSNQESPTDGQETKQEDPVAGASNDEVAAAAPAEPFAEEQALPVEEQPPVEEQAPAQDLPAEGQAPTAEEPQAPKEEAAPNVDAEAPSETKEAEGTKFETPVLYGEETPEGAKPEPETPEGAKPEPETPSEGQETKDAESTQFVKPVLYGEESTDAGNPETKVEGAEPPTNEEISAKPIAVTEAPVVEKAEATPKQEDTNIQSVTEVKKPDTGSVKRGRVLTPGESNAAKESEPSETDHEKLHHHQSANAVIDGSGTETLAGSEAAVKKMAAKENLKESELPKSGESSEQESRKDSKILIILLVAVVVIGCAAFAYNFIKKRKQKKTETRTENGNSAQQKTAADKDAEQGTELKPLMKTNDEKPVVEYKDEKTVAA